MKEFVFVPEGTSGCNVKAWIHEQNIRQEVKQRMHPAVIVCPGGGYSMVSDREAEPVARAYFNAGYNTYILRYAVREEAKGFNPLCQLAATIADVRKNADAWYTVADQIAVCGFSAGAHLAGSLGTFFNEEKFLKVFGREDYIRPDAMILGYPVITADEYAHTGSISNVSGSEVGSEEYKWFGLDTHVDSETPPTFLWHTAPDTVVPVENSLKMCTALSAAKVPFELHILPKGGHGMSTCTREVATHNPYNARWMDWSITWLNTLFQFEL